MKVGGSNVTSRKWVNLFLTTLLWGGLITLFVSFFVQNEHYVTAFNPFSIWEVIILMLMYLGLGFIFSVISQMAFFAYLTVHQFGLGMFRKLWAPIQIVLILFTLFDLVYFRYKAVSGEAGVASFFVLPAALLLFGWAVAYLKSKETNSKAFIPALFFMVVITSVELVPAFQADDSDWVMLMLPAVLFCNTYQLLVLHRLNDGETKAEAVPASNTPKKGQKKKKNRKKKSKR